MKLYGLQKLTLLDYPGRMACTVFTGGCNFRCPFCHNASLVLTPGRDGLIPEEEFWALLEKRRGILDGVCVTGGEPLLQPDLAEFLEKIHALGYKVKLDTNGSFPDRLEQLAAAGLLDYVAMDLKSSRAGYAKVIGVPGFDTKGVERSVAFLMQGTIPYEFRTTVVKGLHTESDFAEIAEWIAGAQHYFLQGFVDSGELIGSGLGAFSREEMQDFLKIVQKRIPSAQLRGV
jgi:pyruvate formate lyase activating enzyme